MMAYRKAAEAEPVEAFENFDDFITDVEAEDIVPEAVLEPEPEPEPESKQEEEPPTDPGTSGRRKKKISFV